MPTEMKLWQINKEHPVSISQQKLNLEARLEEWLIHDISLISSDLLLIGQQVKTVYGGFIDLLAVDPVGNLVILELKRDKTPRDIVAQALDYASWVQDLGHESIMEIANGFLKGKTLEQAFREKFQTDLPDVLNERHRMYIVASSLDSATERIGSTFPKLTTLTSTLQHSPILKPEMENFLADHYSSTRQKYKSALKASQNASLPVLGRKFVGSRNRMTYSISTTKHFPSSAHCMIARIGQEPM
ncbi:MAG: DUF91 domain-containing protein [Anaerolineaceae bacterium]|nr:DUF91 domain-containing protein [Anaerolineaceae bacterium]